jgi:murein DD-endopeptidase MepM/ murein hydrolase activator NlpD
MLFKAPIGTEEERIFGEIWPKGWSDATGFLNAKAPNYAYGVHTGADLNRNVSGGWNSDAHSPVYAIGDGIITYAQRWPNPKYWGNIIVIDHGTVDGKPLFSRYAHVENITFDLVKVNQPIYMGDQIAQVGDGFGLFDDYHLHFDISITDILRKEPNNWPAPASNPSKKLVTDHYIDPRDWLRQHVKAGPVISSRNSKVQDAKTAAPGITVWHVITRAGLPVRQAPSLAAAQVALLSHGSTLALEKGAASQDGFIWGKISSGPHAGNWLQIRKQDQSETYVSTNPPQS